MLLRVIKRKHKLLVSLSLIVISLVLLATVFNNALFAFWDSLVTFGRSMLVYFRFSFLQQEIYERPIHPPTQSILPGTPSAFFSNLGVFFRTLFNGANFSAYWIAFEDFLVVFTMILPFFVLAIFMFRMYIVRIFTKKKNSNYNKDTKPLKGFKWGLNRSYYPIKDFIVSMLKYLSESRIPRLLLIIWLFNLNIVSILLYAISFVLYFFISFDFVSFYYFLHNVVVLLAPAVRYIPFIFWFILALVIIDRRRKRRALRVQHAMEGSNWEFIKNRDICLFVHGPPGHGKTTAITDMALTTEAHFRYKAYEIMFNHDLKFPHFPWILFEKRLEQEIDNGRVFNLAGCRKLVRTIRYGFERGFTNNLFDYNYKAHGLELDDGKVMVDFFDCLSTYAEAYFIYTVKSSLMFSNYSIRTDGVQSPSPNLPIWNFDYFNRKPVDIKILSRHSHILSMDMLRRGKKLIKNNELSGCFEFGIICITEIGKERGNQFKEQELKSIVSELKDCKKQKLAIKKEREKSLKDSSVVTQEIEDLEAELARYSDRATILNDKFNLTLKLIRHSATVDNFPFVKVFVDDQREESLAADARDLCEVVSIEDKSETRLVMRFFFIEQFFYDLLFYRFRRVYEQYRHNRGDNTLLMFIFKTFTALVNRYHCRIHNRFDYHILRLSCFRSIGDKVTAEADYYISTKKIYSNRFATDAFRDLFDKRLLSCGIGVDDISEYDCYRAKAHEFDCQDSYFIEEVKKYENF